MQKAFVVSDIHGMYEQFIELLEHWNRADMLVILGDMIDRGPDSLKVVQHVMELQKEHNVVVLQGNHDQMLIDFVKDPLENGDLYYYHNGGGPTMVSFGDDDAILFKSFVERAEIIERKRKKELQFLEAAHLHYEWGKVLFTHAGFASYLEHWQQTTYNQFTWIRDHYKHKNNSGYVNVFGHTPTQLINADQSNDVWVSEDKTYIAIDGACAYGGQLNGIVINAAGELLETYAV